MLGQDRPLGQDPGDVSSRLTPSAMPKSPEEIQAELTAIMAEFEASLKELEKERKELLDSTVKEAEAELIAKLRSDIDAKFN